VSTVAVLSVGFQSPGGTPERIGVCGCSGNLFSTLGVNPIMGRAFAPEEDRFGAPGVAVIRYGLWQRQYGGAPDVIGKSIRIDGENHQIIGVMPRGFMFPTRLWEVWRT